MAKTKRASRAIVIAFQGGIGPHIPAAVAWRENRMAVIESADRILRATSRLSEDPDDVGFGFAAAGFKHACSEFRSQFRLSSDLLPEMETLTTDDFLATCCNMAPEDRQAIRLALAILDRIEPVIASWIQSRYAGEEREFPLGGLSTIRGFTRAVAGESRWSRFHPPKEWLSQLDIGQTTFQRRVKAAEYITHPDGTTRTVAIMLDCLPADFVDW